MLIPQDYHGLVYQIACKFTHKIGQSVEDLVQEAMLHLWRKAHLYDATKSKETTFVYNLVTRKFIDMLAYENRRKACAAMAASAEVDFAEEPTPYVEYSRDAQVALEMVTKIQGTHRRKSNLVKALKRQGWSEPKIAKTFQEITESIGHRRKVKAYIVSNQ